MGLEPYFAASTYFLRTATRASWERHCLIAVSRTAKLEKLPLALSGSKT